MKKISILLAVLLVVGCIFGGCTGSQESKPAESQNQSSEESKDSTVPDEGYDGSAVTITFYHTMGQNLNSVLDEYIAEFNKLYPNITVEWTQVGGYNDVRDQIKTEITVGNQPNIAYCYPDHVALYNKAQAVQTLDELIANKAEVTRADGTTEIMGLTEEQIADYIEGFYAEGASFGDGLMYTLPFSKSTEVLYYNKTFFEENKLEVPTTWDELYEVCKKIKAIDPECIPFGYDSEANWFITLAEQIGSDYTSATGDHYLFDNETNRDLMEKLNGWYNEGLLTTQALYGSYMSNIFKEKKLYLCIGSTGGSNYQVPDRVDGVYPWEVGVAPIPTFEGKELKAISQGPSVCIFKKSNKQEVYASWLFVKYLTTSIEFQADFARKSGYMPVIKSVDSDELFSEYLADADGGANISALCIKVGRETNDAYFTSPAFVGSSTARDQVGSLLAKCLSFKEADGNIKDQIQKAFRDAIEECEYQD